MHPPHVQTDVFQRRRSKAEITFWIWPIHSAPVRYREIPSVFRNTLPISSAHYARRSSHGRIICALISEPTPMSDRSCVQSAARHSPVNTTGNDTKGCILVRRNLFAEAIYHGMETGVVVVDSPGPTLLVAISDPKQVEFASSPCWMRNPKSGTVFSWSSSNSHSKRLDICNRSHSPWLCLVSREWMASLVTISFSLLHFLHNTPHSKLYNGIRSLLQAKIQAKPAVGVVSMQAPAVNSAMTRKIPA